MAELHLDLHSGPPSVAWGVEPDDEDFDDAAFEEALLAARRRQLAELASLDAA